MPLTAHEIQPAFALWREVEGGAGHLLNHSENQTFRIDTPNGGRYSLRVHRRGYQSAGSIEAELTWLMALRRGTAVPVPEPLPGHNGQLLQSFRTPDGEPYLAVLFHFIAGQEPLPSDNLAGLFGTLGGYAATLHQQAMNWKPPPGFQRQVWQASTILDADGLWGDWRVAPGVDASIRPVLDQLEAVLRQRLGDYGTVPDRFGLIHADMRLGNLLVDGERVTLIDFDDCGFCWFTYDFAAAISFHETSPTIPALRAAWLDGYRRIRSLTEEDIASLDTMVMLRRMALLAWIGSHAETGLARTHMTGFAAGTAALAERYLRGSIWS